MAYQITWTATVEWVGEGIGAMAQGPAGPTPIAQSLEVQGITPVIGGVQGATVTSGNLTTAATTAGTAIGTAITTAANLALIQGWLSGNP